MSAGRMNTESEAEQQLIADLRELGSVSGGGLPAGSLSNVLRSRRRKRANRAASVALIALSLTGAFAMSNQQYDATAEAHTVVGAHRNETGAEDRQRLADGSEEQVAPPLHEAGLADSHVIEAERHNEPAPPVDVHQVRREVERYLQEIGAERGFVRKSHSGLVTFLLIGVRDLGYLELKQELSSRLEHIRSAEIAVRAGGIQDCMMLAVVSAN